MLIYFKDYYYVHQIAFFLYSKLQLIAIMSPFLFYKFQSLETFILINNMCKLFYASKFIPHHKIVIGNMKFNEHWKHLNSYLPDGEANLINAGLLPERGFCIALRSG